MVGRSRLIAIAIVASLLPAGVTCQEVGTQRDYAPSDSTAVLAWDGVKDSQGYRIYIGTAPGTYFQANDVGNTTTQTVTGLNSGSRYYFVVTAYDASNESAPSNEVFKDIP